MEWDQISEKWVAMTQRLRHDCSPAPRTIDRLKTTERQIKATDGTQGDSLPPRMSGWASGRDRSLTSNE
jgi:hypothetical protein